MKSPVVSIILVVLGTVLLLANLGILHIRSLGALFHTWWPVILIVVGLLGLFGKAGR